MDEIERLFREYNAHLVRYLTRRLGDSDHAEEIAQETFLRAMRQLEKGAPLSSERSWLFAVATNMVRDEARKEERRRSRLEMLKAEAREAERDIHPLPIEREENAALARRAMESLTERDREALLMREEGLDYNEIAAALELSAGSVGTTLSRARRRLLESYEALERRRGSGSDG
jgi:RNA polymerase sigma-70 factor, ECF subfamily